MSKRTYPHYVGKQKGRKWTPTVLCEVCGKPATCFAEIQWSWFRGDDESYRVCDEHLAEARSDANGLAGRAEAKRAFLKTCSPSSATCVQEEKW